MAEESKSAEAPKVVLPYDPEPKHVQEKRDLLKGANKALNDKLAALAHFQTVFGADSAEYAKAMDQVVAAQLVANEAAHHKSVAALSHGVEMAAKHVEDAKAKLDDASDEESEAASFAFYQATKSHKDVSARLAARKAAAPASVSSKGGK